ncbi:MAG: hypothetical protein JSS79_02235 [Bacteroidetes bacterium]|nr:hypothetical protein [Bacteroidota bacterium]
MKKITFTLLAAVLLSFAGCNFSAGTKKDFATGLSQTYHGFTVDEVLLVGPDNKAMSNNKVAVGTKVAIVIQGLAGYELKDNKAYPGLSLSVTDKDGKTVLGAEDLFGQNEGFSTADASVLRGTLTVGDPMKAGETYHVKVHAWDKNNKENELTAEVDIVVE